MYVASPLSMIQSYRTHNDYYRVSTVQRVASSKPSAAHQGRPFPYEQTAYHHKAKAAATELAALLKSAQNVKQTAQSLVSGPAAGILNQRVVVTSKPHGLKAEAKANASLQTHKLQVLSLADAQSNAGVSSSRHSATPVQTGWNEFSLQQGDELTSFSIHIGAEDSFEQSLIKIQKALNRQGTGIHASIIEDRTNKVHLELTSLHSGENHTFTLSDLSGNAVSALGLDHIHNPAANAAYNLNGKLFTSDTNIIFADEGKLKLTLLQSDTGDITVTTSPDSEAIVQPIKKLIDEYNEFQQKLSNSPDFLNRSMIQGLGRAASPLDLNELGISEDSQGALLLDESKLKKQVIEQYERISKSLGSVNGLASGLAHSFATMEELPAQALFQLDASALKSYGQYKSQLQAYLPVPMNGLLLDRMM
jgi:flagellar capping protein FliD